MGRLNGGTCTHTHTHDKHTTFLLFHDYDYDSLSLSLLGFGPTTYLASSLPSFRLSKTHIRALLVLETTLRINLARNVLTISLFCKPIGLSLPRLPSTRSCLDLRSRGRHRHTRVPHSGTATQVRASLSSCSACADERLAVQLCRPGRGQGQGRVGANLVSTAYDFIDVLEHDQNELTSPSTSQGSSDESARAMQVVSAVC